MQTEENQGYVHLGPMALKTPGYLEAMKRIEGNAAQQEPKPVEEKETHKLRTIIAPYKGMRFKFVVDEKTPVDWTPNHAQRRTAWAQWHREQRKRLHHIAQDKPMLICKRCNLDTFGALPDRCQCPVIRPIRLERVNYA